MPGTMTFEAVFTRYNPKEGRRISAPEHINAENFGDAMDKCHVYLRGARASDPENEYAIVSLTAIGYGGTQCVVGWQTRREFAEETGDEAALRQLDEEEAGK